MQAHTHTHTHTHMRAHTHTRTHSQYTPFNPAMDHDHVLNDLRWNLVRGVRMHAFTRARPMLHSTHPSVRPGNTWRPPCV